MKHDPDLVYIPATLIDDRRIDHRDRAALMHLIALADNSARCDHDEHALARELGVTVRTLRKRLARLEELGYVVNHRSWVEMSDDLVLDDGCAFMADLPPLTDEEFAQLQAADDPDDFLKAARRGPRRQEALRRPAPRRSHRPARAPPCAPAGGRLTPPTALPRRGPAAPARRIALLRPGATEPTRQRRRRIGGRGHRRQRGRRG